MLQEKLVLKELPNLQVPVQALNSNWFSAPFKKLDILRLDLLHPVISGNKWFKLRYNLDFAVHNGFKSVLTFGGGYSNHLIATAAAARFSGLKSIGMVRGDYSGKHKTRTLKDCEDYGMEIHYLNRDLYRQKSEPEFLKSISDKFSKPFIIPEGGAGEQGIKGAGEIARLIPAGYTHVCVSAGTGTTLAGLAGTLPENSSLLGFVPMKNGRYLKETVLKYLRAGTEKRIHWFDRWHFGGFGKYDKTLIAFMNEFYYQHQIPLDVIYTSKMMYGIRDLISEEFFGNNASVLCIHTGGLQGNISVKDKLDFKIPFRDL